MGKAGMKLGRLAERGCQKHACEREPFRKVRLNLLTGMYILPIGG